MPDERLQCRSVQQESKAPCTDEIINPHGAHIYINDVVVLTVLFVLYMSLFCWLEVVFLFETTTFLILVCVKRTPDERPQCRSVNGVKGEQLCR